MEHILPELRKPDWDVLIAHFLGVDHCGHRYGPSHPEMASKLTQINGAITQVLKELEGDNETVLFVLGDHGMTRHGELTIKIGKLRATNCEFLVLLTLAMSDVLRVR